MFILIIWSIRFLYMYLNTDNHSFEWHLIHFNPVKMANIDNKLNLFNASFGCLFVYFIYILYFCNNTRATQLIYRVLIDGDHRFFIREKSSIDEQNIIVNDDDDYQRQKIVRRIRLWLTIYHQAFHFLYYASYLLAIIYEIQILMMLKKFGYFSSIPGIINIIIELFHLILVIIGGQTCLDISFIFGACFITITMILFTKFQQIKTKWLDRKKHVKSIKINRKIIWNIRNRIIKMLILIESIDHTYGILMFLFILFNFPMNAYLTMITIITKTKPFTEQLLHQTITINQWSYIFVFHYIAIRFGYYLHLPSKYFINRYYLKCTKPSTNRTTMMMIMNIRDRLQFSDWLEKFHTKKRYGLTYGRTNLITMSTFVQVNFLNYLNFNSLKIVIFHSKKF
ncbi:uncharacterized protein LOC142644879 [Dermatophagoides pteronyssinus]|uniref:uncharacterized protein LOC142644879 n=1 Tax=Dermatophagoides pteronyssinus TaxID=6956 RepID=UPI003F66C264